MPATQKRLPPFGEFLNVDVELTSPKPFKTLPQELEKSCVLLFNAKANREHLLAFETQESFSMRRFSPRSRIERTLRALLQTIEKLSPPARREWNAAKSRLFDIGFDASPRTATSRLAARVHVPTEFLKRITALNADLIFTVYKPEPPLLASRPPRAKQNPNVTAFVTASRRAYRSS